MTLATDQLKKYLWYVCKLEQDLFTLGNALDEIDCEINNLKGTYKCNPPKKPKEVSPTSTFFSTLGMWILIAGAALIVLWLVGMGLTLICEAFGLYRIESFVVYCVFGIPILLLLLGIYSAIISSVNESKNYKRDMKRYRRDCELYKTESKEANSSRTKKRSRLISEKNKLVNLYNSQLDLLQNMYNLNIIHRNYRNWPAVTAFYGYIDKRICTKLEGHEGAYNKYDVDLQFGRINGKLDDIINKLYTLSANQNIIVNLIKQSNEDNSRIVKQVEDFSREISQNSAATSYYSMISARNSSISAFLSLYDHF